jgi:hypothetical protein
MKTTVQRKSRESESPEPVPSAKTGPKRPDDLLDPDFVIEATGGPSDSGGGTRTGPLPPPKAATATKGVGTRRPASKATEKKTNVRR